MKKMKNIEQQPIKSNELSCGEMICGSVKIHDSSSITNTCIKQCVSMIKDDMSNLMKQTKLNVELIELDSKNIITDNLKIVYDTQKS